MKAALIYAKLARNEYTDRLVANPELSTAKALPRLRQEAASLYLTPELKVLALRDVTMEEAYEDDFFTTTPEIKVHPRFVEGLGK